VVNTSTSTFSERKSPEITICDIEVCWYGLQKKAWYIIFIVGGCVILGLSVLLLCVCRNGKKKKNLQQRDRVVKV
jgi:hypothetical protein